MSGMGCKAALVAAVFGSVLVLSAAAEAGRLSARDKRSIVTAVNQQQNRTYLSSELSGSKQRISKGVYRASFTVSHDVVLQNGARIHGGCTGSCMLGRSSTVSQLRVAFMRAAPPMFTRGSTLRSLMQR
jgi:hypothetical protein